MEECNNGQADQHQQSRGQLGDKCEVVISNDLMVQESERHDVIVDKKDSETRLIEVRGKEFHMNELHNVVSHNIDLPIDDMYNDEKKTETNPIDDAEAISIVMGTVSREAEV
ncbi:hypothetical protein K7X08_000795 [Anisodus acutangulus]|uniref:Uncharacterized protein n=1 Tax=Anisodus acutangulus TaxID=402998 RepID=A0A9Q1RFU3_9SOLA|nr:hypothetical protein K7X08_000795 [Anisodus acutangulus]